MARPESPHLPGKLELVATLDRTRAALSRDLDGVGRVLDLPTQFRTSYASDWWRWLVGALAVGVVAGLRLLPPGGKPSSTPSANGAKSAKSAGPVVPVAATIAGMVLRQLLSSAAQPALSRLLGPEIDKWISAVLRKP